VFSASDETISTFSAWMQLVGQQEGNPAYNKSYYIAADEKACGGMYCLMSVFVVNSLILLE